MAGLWENPLYRPQTWSPVHGCTCRTLPVLPGELHEPKCKNPDSEWAWWHCNDGWWKPRQHPLDAAVLLTAWHGALPGASMQVIDVKTGEVAWRHVGTDPERPSPGLAVLPEWADLVLPLARQRLAAHSDDQPSDPTPPPARPIEPATAAATASLQDTLF